jgi:hypothetical protein
MLRGATALLILLGTSSAFAQASGAQSKTPEGPIYNFNLLGSWSTDANCDPRKAGRIDFVSESLRLSADLFVEGTGVFGLWHGDIYCVMDSAKRKDATTLSMPAVCNIEEVTVGKGQVTVRILGRDKIILSAPTALGLPRNKYDLRRC